MIELTGNELKVSCSEVHEKASMGIEFQRTLRIPDDDKEHFLPPGLGRFPLRHVDDFAKTVPPSWMDRGGVMLPMFQAEALWIDFGDEGYPFALKIAAGKINAVTGEAWSNGLSAKPQDYVVTPGQPWLDGFCVEKGRIRQFVAMPLGSGYSAEEQLTDEAEYGGLQIVAYPMKAAYYERLMKKRRRSRRVGYRGVFECASLEVGMGLAAGGKMRQNIQKDEHGLKAWDTEHASRCFVHMANSLVWSSITGQEPPHPPPTAKSYTDAGLPWFDYYDESKALEGGTRLKKLQSVAERGEQQGEVPLPENDSVSDPLVVKLKAARKEGQVREWSGE